MDSGATEYLLSRYGGPVPRYTSYPPAVHFKSGFKQQPADGKDSDSRTVSVYVHIPFCRSLCSYCGCMTRVAHDDEPVKNYMALLEREIALVSESAGYRLNAGQVHFGGGSPNLLDGRALGALINLIDRHFNIADDAEIAVEADPRQMTREKAKDYAVAGVNRVSLGVQDFNDDTQAAINRVQPFSMIEDCMSWLRGAGVKGINFDLMYGLPYQTEASVSGNIEKAVSLGPDRVAVFGYAHVPWMRPHQKILERHPMPGGQERYRQAEAARAALLGAGYLGVGMDHFALPQDSLARAASAGTLRRNFQGYTTDRFDDLVGLGLSSISKTSDAYLQNTSSFKTYKEKIDGGVLPVERGCTLDADDKMRAELIERLMCYLEADADDVCRKHGFPAGYLGKEIESLNGMVQDGLLLQDGPVIRMTEQGRPFVRTVCAAFDAYLDKGQGRHARAV